MFTVDPTLVVCEFGTQEEFQAEATRFEQALGFCFLEVVWAPARPDQPEWVVELALHLDRWDCWLFEPEEPTEEYQALEALELAAER